MQRPPSRVSPATRPASPIAWLLPLLCLVICSGTRPASALHAQPSAPPTAQKPEPRPLTLVGAVHQLTHEEAAEGRPVHLHGIVTAVSGWKNSFFLQDRTGGVSVDSVEPTGARAGEEVELDGQTGPGLFAPVVNALRVRDLGRGTLPRTALFTYGELMTGAGDSQWIAVHGVVRSAKVTPLWNTHTLDLTIEVNRSPVKAMIQKYAAGDAAKLVDAVVTVRGVGASNFNAKHQFLDVSLFVPDMSQVQITEPAPVNPFAMPVSPVQSILQFKPGVDNGHRLKISGRVTYQDPGHALYLQNGSDGVMLYTEQNTPVPLGTKIEATGFPDLGAYSPVLRYAEFRVVGPAQPIQPIAIHAADFLATAFLQGSKMFTYSPYDSQLVNLVGELVEVMPQGRDQVWLVRSGAMDIPVVMRWNPDVKLPPIAKGSTVSATGVFVMQVDDDRQPVSFHILISTPSDIVVLKKASWWTPQHALVVLALVVLASAGSGLWIVTLRRRVHQQTQMLRESERRFREQAQRDTLTGLASRAFLYEQLNAAIQAAGGQKNGMGILMVDLDHFKEVNDTLGHHAGDQLLRVVGDRLRASVRKSDTVARMGGDEFVVLLSDVNDTADAERIGTKVVASLSLPAMIEGKPMHISASVGVCLYPEGGLDGDALLQNVDTAMYQAKAQGRNTFAIYSA